MSQEFPAVFIDRKPYAKRHTIVPIAPVLTRDMDEAVRRRAIEMCPKNARLGTVAVQGVVTVPEYDRDKMALSFFRYDGDERSMPGYREWRKTDEVWATIEGQKKRLWVYVEQDYTGEAPPLRVASPKTVPAVPDGKPVKPT